MSSTATGSLDQLLCLTAVANFAAYTFAPPILVTPLGALSVLIGYVLRIVHVVLS